MPIVTIQITREGTTREQKAALIKGATDLLVEVLTSSSSRKWNAKIGESAAFPFLSTGGGLRVRRHDKSYFYRMSYIASGIRGQVDHLQ